MCSPRNLIINLENTVFYHCVTRCVQGEYLCGFDGLTGNDFSHRKQWIIDRAKFLTGCFFIEICAYAILSNHYHLVLRVNLEEAKCLSDEEIIVHWTKLYPNTKKYSQLEILLSLDDELSKLKAQEIIEEWREKLVSISCFMQALNQKISYRSNKESGKKGHFWQGRFSSQALLDDTALLSCMAYVDLNPVRAGLTTSLEESEFTSIQERIKVFRQSGGLCQPNKLVSLGEKFEGQTTIPIKYSLFDYFELVDVTGRIIRNDKRGYIPNDAESLLVGLRVDINKWLDLTQSFEKKFAGFAGRTESLYDIAFRVGKSHLKGVGL